MNTVWMRRLLLSAASAVAITAASAEANAKTWTFNFTGAAVTWNSPTTGAYKIIAWGAQGGAGTNGASGAGAEMGGKITLTQGETLTLLIGGQGASGAHGDGYGGGGGGGAAAFERGMRCEGLGWARLWPR